MWLLSTYAKPREVATNPKVVTVAHQYSTTSVAVIDSPHTGN